MRPAGSVAIVLGTRPEAIKLASIVGALGDAAWVVHTGQHFDQTMAADVLDAVGFPPVGVHLGVGGTSRGAQIGAAITALDSLFTERRPRAIVVQGDTNAVVSGAMAANALDIPLFHVEAGLRSYDRSMPEEHNRVIADHLSTWCGAPTEIAKSQLLAEGIDAARVEVTGNTIVDVVPRLLPSPAERRQAVARHGLDSGDFVLATIHRPENTDDRDVLASVLTALAALPLPVLLPLHPRTAARVEHFGLGALLDQIRTVEPLEPRTFLGLGAEAALWITDSGGLQEEASVLKRPVVVVRRSTERPEVQGTFAHLVEPGPAVVETCRALLDDLDAVHQRLAGTPTPYGDGRAGERIVAAIDRVALG